MWRAKALAFAKTQQATEWLAHNRLQQKTT
jgi:hypothetical protein